MPADNKQRKGAHPYRKPRSANPSDPSSSDKPARPKPTHRIPATEARDEAGIPGLSKLKSSIRQTKRLLAKENLEPGLRVSTQRRLTSLEADLAAAERRELEKKNGAKYHKVKFFERQKLVRLIRRLNRKLLDSETSSKKRSKHEEELLDARIMLNYVLHFPNTQKYISLFPSNPNQTENEDDDVDSSKPKLKLPALLHPIPSAEECEKMDKPTKRRYDLLLETKKLMEEGKLKNEPETDLKKGQVDGVVVGLGANVEIGLEDKKEAKQNPAQASGEEEDDFFESGDE
ncbi:rRNA-processing protein EFG1 [Cryptococcus deuterogattii 99/473]|uniref:rRNA-processing protein EFG1 n=1 Tax=Cryptococcus deuterogattii Ram5 TaxID=1296110 RepID=A0A0D0V0M8_9TREE|nr:rRNA-processing protein EFG1 [Cryptococcus deuterogattii Ram5]KIR97026.1 rRNA-processing protein EFG1 [Cryptococcus deuterogattii 2001/935-1]KIY55090.1 rRNA-processing protein EFG1 [Cryptococcus deuterogattii 99/473]